MLNSNNIFKSFTEAYLKIIKDVLANGEWVPGVKDANSIGSKFGKKEIRTKEILAYNFSVTNPRNRYLNVTNRDINNAYSLANFLWILLGNKNSTPVLAFNEKGKAFVNKRGEIDSAIGPHIFKLRKGTYFDLNRIELLFKKDPSTRRAVIQLLDQKDLLRLNKDVPCFNHIHFFLRKGKLHCQVVMRSQNALRILPYDFFVFSLLHEALSVRLKVKLGTIFYTSNSLHIYEDDIVLAKNLFANEPKYKNFSMLQFDNQTIKSLSKFFIELSRLHRNDTSFNLTALINKYKVDSYWQILLKRHFDFL
jgi:thymidylate synthase